jgi:nitrate reductase NapAB chaperone NapD
MNKKNKSNVYNKEQRKNYIKTLISKIEDNKIELSNENKKIVFCDALNYKELKKLIKSLNKFKNLMINYLKIIQLNKQIFQNV